MKRHTIHKLSMQSLGYELPNGRILFENLNFEIPLGSMIWLRGETGTGKSMMLKMLLGVVSPQAGQILINDQDLTQMSFEELLPYKLNMGLSFDFGGLINNRDVQGNLSLPLEYHKFGNALEIENQISKYLDVFNLKKVAHERPSSVVGGVRKAVCVARAFVHEPQLLLLDDPTTGLRGDTKTRLKNATTEALSKGQTIIVVTEDIDFMKDFDPKIYELNNGSLSFENKRKVA